MKKEKKKEEKSGDLSISPTPLGVEFMVVDGSGGGPLLLELSGLGLLFIYDDDDDGCRDRFEILEIT